MWSPKSYKIHLPSRDGTNSGSTWGDEVVTIDFTAFSKSAFNYMGFNTNLNDSSRDEYDITKPSLLYNDGSIFMNGNVADNQQNSGLLLYSKSVLKQYPSNTYYNTFR